MEWNFTEYFVWNGEFFLEISQCVPKLAKLAVFTNLLLTARLEFILGKQSPFFVTTQLAGSGSEAKSFYKLSESLTHVVTHLIVTQDFEFWKLRWGNNCNQSFCHNSTCQLNFSIKWVTHQWLRLWLLSQSVLIELEFVFIQALYN